MPPGGHCRVRCSLQFSYALRTPACRGVCVHRYPRKELVFSFAVFLSDFSAVVQMGLTLAMRMPLPFFFFL